ncbi:family 16 glycosylhydrolase [Streptomyces sp. JH002]|uniref:family 16 glycosylhydrolase n=1 Tax=Streptomyces sp. JH002 TaxID=2763259 RepID=UPI003D80371F
MKRRHALRTPTRGLLAAGLSLALAWTALTTMTATADQETDTDVSTAAVLFHDDFNGPAGSAVDSSKWQLETGDNSGNNREHQYYTPGNNNAALDGNGNLVITARKENPNNYQCWYGTCQYTSARMNTAGKFTTTYGKVEARIKLPRGQGIWPAFWMLGNDIGQIGWPASGEIDIMENIGREPGTVHGTLHGPGYSGGGGIGASYTLPGGRAFADDFHTFAVDWAPDRISWSVDGVTYQTRTPADLGGNQWAFNKPFFMILNLAVGGEWPGYPDGSTTFPQQMIVDYVTVTSYDGGGDNGGGNGRTGQISGLAGKCVDVAGSNTANGTPVVLYDCNGSSAQRWTVHSDGTLRALGKCLSLVGSATGDGTKVHLWDCTGNATQRWAISGARDIVNISADKCLDVPWADPANNNQLQIATCSGNAAQKWTAP